MYTTLLYDYNYNYIYIMLFFMIERLDKNERRQTDSFHAAPTSYHVELLRKQTDDDVITARDKTVCFNYLSNGANAPLTLSIDIVSPYNRGRTPFSLLE